MDISHICILFLYEFKLSHNAGDSARNINKSFGYGTVNEKRRTRIIPKIPIDPSISQNEARRHAAPDAEKKTNCEN